MTTMETIQKIQSNIDELDGEVFFIAVCGGSASGKTSVCSKIFSNFGSKQVAVIDSDSFYKPLSEKDREDIENYNFDHPNSIDFNLLYETLVNLKNKKEVSIPIYCFKTHSRTEKTRLVSPASIIILDGIFVLYDPRIRKLYHMSIFVDTDDDTRLLRRIRRDVSERNRTMDSILLQYEKTVKPSYEDYIYPTRRYADIIIPHYPNEVAVDLVVQHIKQKLKIDDLRKIYSNLYLLPQNCQIRNIHTILRNNNTSGAEFVFCADRLIRLVVENALGLLPFRYQTVQTPILHDYDGLNFDLKNNLCALALIRGGESMLIGVRAVCNDIPIAKVLFEFEDKTTELDANNDKSEIIFAQLPEDIKNRYILVLDPVLSNGYSVSSAIKYLLSMSILPQKIMVLSLIASPNAINNLCSSFPDVTLFTTEIDKCVTSEGFVVPGIGSFADRYFGTE